MSCPLLIFLLSLLVSPVRTHAAGSVQVIQTPNEGIVPDAEIDHQGVIHLAYVSGEDVYYVKSSDRGKSFSTPIRVNTEAGTTFGGRYRGPDIAIGQEGRIHVIWYTNAYQRRLPEDQWGVFYSYLNVSKTAFVPARNLNHRPSDNYALAADDRGRVAVFWMAGRVYLYLSDDGGETFPSAMAIDQADPCECCASRAYFSTNGTLYFSYRDKADDIRDMYLMVLADGQKTFSREKLSVTSWKINACPMTGTYLTGWNRENLIAGWETKRQVYFARLDPTGHMLPPGEVKATENGKYPVVLSTPDGTALVAWKTGSTLEWRMYDAGGKPQGSPGSAPVSNAHRPAGVVTREGEFLLFP
jgi:hypothetical protein